MAPRAFDPISDCPTPTALRAVRPSRIKTVAPGARHGSQKGHRRSRRGARRANGDADRFANGSGPPPTPASHPSTDVPASRSTTPPPLGAATTASGAHCSSLPSSPPTAPMPVPATPANTPKAGTTTPPRSASPAGCDLIWAMLTRCEPCDAPAYAPARVTEVGTSASAPCQPIAATREPKERIRHTTPDNETGIPPAGPVTGLSPRSAVPVLSGTVSPS